MGQKVNPHGLRTGIVRDWESQWYEDEGYNENIDFVKDSILIMYLKCSLDDSAIKQFVRRVMQKIAKRLVLPRQRLLA